MQTEITILEQKLKSQQLELEKQTDEVYIYVIHVQYSVCMCLMH